MFQKKRRKYQIRDPDSGLGKFNIDPVLTITGNSRLHIIIEIAH